MEYTGQTDRAKLWSCIIRAACRDVKSIAQDLTSSMPVALWAVGSN